ncbi:hypothetical protein AAT19DRAFT_14254 [Rhodotorula toruloides]|uniref:Uncharacterized protein n=1 Tax=Rhodotorula toruloides TaxID=5286 RepID=A0A2T0AB51_RHOTO|nr:hypothetical protein AAT19DRAFT_14254 [Rhodotorula toruloides]
MLFAAPAHGRYHFGSTKIRRRRGGTPPRQMRRSSRRTTLASSFCSASEPNKYVHGYGNHPRHENVILDAGATILDLRRKLTAEDSGVYSWVNIDDVFILPATSPSQSAEYNDPLEDDTTLASCRKAGHPLIHLNASTRKAEALRKEEETRAAKKRKIIAKLAGLIVRDEAAREDDEY